MGMAAGQARLLSITSRMSDNELRAQLINNDKMRLATKSSQVSEAYVQALNDAQMMFTNYDKDNNVSYQQLTFNALTSYNPYNNQYALTNSSGKVLLSEQDALNYEKSNSLEEFLGLYGLEQKTTFFENLPVSEAGQVLYPNTDGEFVPAGSPNTLEALYFGYKNESGNIVPGYMEIVSSDEYYKFNDKYQQYETAKIEYENTIATSMRKKVVDILQATKEETEIGAKLEKLMTAINTEIKPLAYEDLNEYLDDLSERAQYAKDGLDINTEVKISKGDNSNEFIIDNKYKVTCIKDASGNITGFSELNVKYDKEIQKEDGKSDYEYDVWGTPEQAKSDVGFVATLSGFTINANGTTYDINNLKNINSASSYDDTLGYYNGTYAISTTIIDDETKEEIAESIISHLEASITQIFDINNVQWQKDSDGKNIPEFDRYIDAAEALCNELGLTGMTLSNYSILDDVLGNQSKLLSKIKGENQDKKREDFTNICTALLLDNVMNTYGEPKIAWIDRYNPNENGETKMQWYSNLYEKIQASGYHTLKDGLASSPEWIKFAFESGLVNMEQVDSYNNWNHIIYSNCSDITEQTNAAAVAKAEAEYNAAMKKIENKDKRYDLELKNIDTEHNSLQTEYESIKSAIDKNISRTFKLYG